MSVVTRHGAPSRQATAAVSSPGPISTRLAEGVRRRSQSMNANSPCGISDMSDPF
jgi:hypothetical protein